jgi:hypothetical protein
MYKTCKSCGTIFELDESILSQNIYWLKCSVCNEKWRLSDNKDEYISEKNVNEEKGFTTTEKSDLNETQRVKNELASIKSVVEDQTKRMSKINNPILELKNKSIAEISSELSALKLKSDDKNLEKIDKKNKKISNFLPFILFFLMLFLSALLFFRSGLLAYSYHYFPKQTEKYQEKVNNIFNIIELPVLAELSHIKMVDFVATIQKNNIQFAGVIKNISSRPILTPRIKILAIREDRKILKEQIIVINDRIIMPSSIIEFKEFTKIKFKGENVTIKATILKKMF